MASIPGIRSTRQRGFTLVELVAIIVLVALLAFTALPRLPDVNAMDVSSLSEQLAADIRYTQTLSMTRGDRFRINLTSATYQITDSSGLNPEIHPGSGSTSAVVLEGVALSGYSPPLVNNYVAFDGRGIPYVDASTALSANATITLTAGGSTKSIVISPETGRVAVQ